MSGYIRSFNAEVSEASKRDMAAQGATAARRPHRRAQRLPTARFEATVSPALHRAAKRCSSLLGVSLSRFVAEAVAKHVERSRSAVDAVLSAGRSEPVVDFECSSGDALESDPSDGLA
jgi:hypothetical protein